MHRLTSALSILLFLAACGGNKEPETPKPSDGAESGEGDAGADDDAGGEPKKDVCQGFSISNLEELLGKSDCETTDSPTTLANPDLKGKLEVTLSASPTKATPGGKVDLQVTFTNKTKEPMPLYFRIDPLARFETEAYDVKSKKRVDMPAGNPPPPPKGHNPPPPADQKVAKVTIAPSGYASVRVPWEAVKMKWAPDKVRGTSAEKGFPRTPAGPLPKGKYQVKVVTPLIGVFEGGEHEMSAPAVEIEVGT
ncbi:MAG: hypothetical protein KIT84_27435 [Labilithrix sp.]|nr:hypothetical protein [Labilithrix sp.]MCW5814791.1 hypothetical protein [Labilithrix sp.]